MRRFAIGRVDKDAAEIERARADVRTVRHQFPRRHPVVGTPEIAVLRLHDRVDAAALADQTDAAGQPARQAPADLVPRSRRRRRIDTDRLAYRR